MAKKLRRVHKMVTATPGEEAQYRLRSGFMYRKQKALAGVIQSLRSVDSAKLDWRDPSEIGISQTAFDYVRSEGSPLTDVFCHPKVIESNPSLILYYRSLAGLPQKGATRLAFNTANFEKGDRIPIAKAVDLAKILNSYISEIVDSDPKFSAANAHLMVSMSYGAQMNGSWRNAVGEEGGTRLRQILIGFLRERKVVQTVTYKDGNTLPADKPVDAEQVQEIKLSNGYTLTFSSEPDISLRDSKGNLVAVVEIKAGIDPAGALERYGAAKKSFSRARRENKATETIYLGLMTSRVKREMEDDQVVTKEYEIGGIFANRLERQQFLERILWLSHLQVG